MTNDYQIESDLRSMISEMFMKKNGKLVLKRND